MKVGVRKPSIKKSVSARTTGNINRSIKKSTNPLYGKKGVGIVNNPKKAIYNKVYSKTSISAVDLVKENTVSQKENVLNEDPYIDYNKGDNMKLNNNKMYSQNKKMTESKFLKNKKIAVRYFPFLILVFTILFFVTILIFPVNLLILLSIFIFTKILRFYKTTKNYEEYKNS